MKSAFGYGSTNETMASDKPADATFAWPSASTSNGTPNSAFPFSCLLLRMIQMYLHARFLADVEQMNKVPVFNSIKGERAEKKWSSRSNRQIYAQVFVIY